MINLENELTKVKLTEESAGSYYSFEGGLENREWQKMRNPLDGKSEVTTEEKIQSKFKMK